MDTKFSRRRTPGLARRSPDRRGVAMVLVLIAVGVGTVLAAAALTSRDNSPAIGANAGSLAEASWSAQSAADLAEAILQTDADWRALGANMVSGMSLAGGAVTITVTDIEGNPADADDRELIIRATSTVDGLTSTVERRVSLVPPASLPQVFDPYLSEFALFAGASLTVEAGAEIGRFAASPEARTLSPVRVGTGFSNLGDLTVAPGACLDGVGLFTDTNASAALAASVGTDDSFAEGWPMPIEVPVIAEPLPDEFVELQADAAATPVPPDPLTMPVADRFRAYLPITMMAGEIYTLDGADGADYGVASLAVRGGSVLRIEGDVRLHVTGDLFIGAQGAIELGPEARLTVLVGGNLTVRAGGLGIDRAIAQDPGRTPASVSAYESPSRLWVLAVSPESGGAVSPLYRVWDNGIMMGCIHAPHASFVAEQGGALIGRVTASAVAIRSTGALLYDPRMDTRRGFASKSSPMYNLEGEPIDGLQTTIDAADHTASPKTLMGALVDVVETTTDTLVRTVSIVSEPLDGGLLGGLLSPLLAGDDAVEDEEDDGGGLLGGLLGGILGGKGAQTPPPPAPPEDPPPAAPVVAEGPTPRDGTRLIAHQVALGALDMED